MDVFNARRSSKLIISTADAARRNNRRQKGKTMQDKYTTTMPEVLRAEAAGFKPIVLINGEYYDIEIDRTIENMKAELDGYMFNNLLDDYRENIMQIIEKHLGKHYS